MSKNKINVGFKSSQNIKAPENCACVNGLKVSTNKTQKTIDLTNNKAEYYAELAEEYKNEAKKFMEQSQYYAENNADITVEQFNALEDSLEDYALKSELPVKVSELQNDSLYVKESEMESALNELDVLPSRENCEDMYLKTDGSDVYWDKISSGLEVGDIGIAPLGIDETKGLRRYLNGSVLDVNSNTQEFVNKLQSAALLYPSLVCTEEEWQTIAESSVGGQCGKFAQQFEQEAAVIEAPASGIVIFGRVNYAGTYDEMYCNVYCVPKAPDAIMAGDQVYIYNPATGEIGDMYAGWTVYSYSQEGNNIMITNRARDIYNFSITFSVFGGETLPLFEAVACYGLGYPGSSPLLIYFEGDVPMKGGYLYHCDANSLGVPQNTELITDVVVSDTTYTITTDKTAATEYNKNGSGAIVKKQMIDVLSSVRLPKIVMPIQGLTDMTKLGEIVETGLPNITGSFFLSQMLASDNASGALTLQKTKIGYGGRNGGSNYFDYTYSFDASDSNPIYGNSSTVQQEQIQYPYFIQIATGQETQADITNEIKLNNPFFLGMSQYFEAEPNNLSWLKSAGQWNSKAVYPDYYNWLLQEKNNPETLPADTPNVEFVGNVSNTNGVLSGFGDNIYAQINSVPTNVTSFEMVFKVTTGDSVATEEDQIITGQPANYTSPQLGMNSSASDTSTIGLSFSVANTSTSWGTSFHSLSPALPNTTYWLKGTWDGTTASFYLKTSEEADWVLQESEALATIDWSQPMIIGNDNQGGSRVKPWLGTIDLNECYININGSRWWSGMTNGVKFSTEDYSDYDYVINTSDETFRLPLLDGSEDLPSDNLIHVSGNLTISSPEPVSVYTAPKNCYVTLRTFGMTLVNSAVVGYIDGRVAYTQTFGSLTNQNSDILFMQRNQTLTLHINSVNSTTPTVSYNLNVRAAQGNGSLYYYTGETVQNANLIDAGRIAETKADKTEIDGVWAGSYSVIFTGVSFTAGQSRTYSLSEYLPNDGNIYEVLFIGRVTTGATAGDTARLNLTTSVIPTSYPFVAAQTPAARAMYVIGSVLMPVGVDRNIKVTNTSAGDTATFELAVSAYRKVR